MKQFFFDFLLVVAVMLAFWAGVYLLFLFE